MTNQRSAGAPSSGYQLVPQPEAAMPFAIGEIIADKYEIIKLIGSGGMGFVVSAIHIELGEKVALKFLHPASLANQELVGRFAREARASLKIQSEYVARVFDVGTLPDGSPFIVMEYLEGKDLYETVRDTGPLPIKLAIEYVMQACEALAVAHASGVVHRDIKPENLFLTRRTQGMDIIKVLDFGISKMALTGSPFESNIPLVRTMMPMGSPVYMSPEQIRASADVDARTDIWSLGCVIFELITGSPAFDAPSLTQLTAVILENDPPLLRSLCPNAPPDLEKIVSRCLQKDPARRFQNVGDLALELFPFGPRRARLSAERCLYILKAAGMIGQDYELPSAFPPSLSSLADSAPVSGADVVPSRAGPSIILSPEEIRASGRISRRPKWTYVAAGAGVAAIVAGYIVWHGRASLASQPGWGPEPKESIVVVTPVPIPVVPVAPIVPADLPQVFGVPGVPSVKTSPSAAPVSRAKSPASNPVRPKGAAPAKPAGNDSNANHEPDPGF